MNNSIDEKNNIKFAKISKSKPLQFQHHFHKAVDLTAKTQFYFLLQVTSKLL